MRVASVRNCFRACTAVWGDYAAAGKDDTSIHIHIHIFIFIALEEVFSSLCTLVVPRQAKKMAGEQLSHHKIDTFKI